MSKTMKRNGQRVYDAFGHLTQWGRGTGWEAVTTERVAEKAECSQPTARKYLSIMADQGVVRQEKYGHTYVWRVVLRKD
jgi:response regulator of citrate/malate metabolism